MYFKALCTVFKDPQEVLDAMRSYVHNFFGCRECAAHFENMAAETLEQVTSLPTAVLWLWSRHNVVNNRLAGKSRLGLSLLCRIFFSLFQLSNLNDVKTSLIFY